MLDRHIVVGLKDFWISDSVNEIECCGTGIEVEDTGRFDSFDFFNYLDKIDKTITEFHIPSKTGTILWNEGEVIKALRDKIFDLFFDRA